MSKSDNLTELQIEILKRHYMNGIDKKEVRSLMNINLGVIAFYYGQFKRDGVSKCSVHAQKLIQQKGIFGSSYA